MWQQTAPSFQLSPNKRISVDADDEGYSALGQFRVYIMQSKTSYMALSKSSKGEATTK